MCHAELNAVINKNSSDIKGCNIFVTLFPCNQCAKILIQSGIKEVVYLSDKYSQRDDTKAAKQMFDKVGIKYRYHLFQICHCLMLRMNHIVKLIQTKYTPIIK